MTNSKQNIEILGVFFRKLGLLFLPIFIYSGVVAQTTTVNGTVIDATNLQPVPFANVGLIGTSLGVTTDDDGIFSFTFEGKKTELLITAVGFATKTVKIQPGLKQTLTIIISDEVSQLQQIVIKSGKYRNKNNPAVDLIEKVIAHKKYNRLESHDFYSYKKYEKVEMDLANIGDNIKNSKWLRDFKFVFDRTDSTRLQGKRLLPAFIKETASDVFYRKAPEAKKEYTNGIKQSQLEGLIDADGIGGYLNHLYANVNIYDNSCLLVNKEFLSPLSPLSPTFYRFYIMDTSMIGDKRCINLAFFPRGKTDLTFVGNLYITDDSVYAVRKVKLGLPDNVNINFLNTLTVDQEFEKLPDNTWTLVRDETAIDFGIGDSKKGFGFYGRKVTRLKDFDFTQAKDQTVYAGIQNNIKDEDAAKRDESFWAVARQEPLAASEKGIYETIDSVIKVPKYKSVKKTVGFLFSGFLDANKLEFGPFNTLYSFNPVEGGRLRMGGRTTLGFDKHLRLDAFLAYGTLDKIFKYNGTLSYFLNKDGLNDRIQNIAKVWYTYNTEIPGQVLSNRYEDNFFMSFRRGDGFRMYYKRSFGISYIHEAETGFTYQFGVQNMQWTPAGSLTFHRVDSTGNLIKIKSSQVTDYFIDLRFAPNEEFFQGKKKRKQIINRYPIYGLHYHYGNGLGATLRDLDYHNLSFDVFKRFYLSPIGKTDVMFEIGRLWGTVPFPLLINHRANQTLAYLDNSFNMMNSLEFVSDKYVSLNIAHFFDGFFFNKIPLLNKLKWREIITFKTIYGGLDQQNIPGAHQNTFLFPVDKITGLPTTFTFNHGPYMEASVGIGNIFKVLRVDLVRRLNYLDNPDVSKYAVRFKMRFEF